MFSVERLEQHGESLAAAQLITSRPRRGRDIRPRVAENGRVLIESYRELTRAVNEERPITPAAEWLIDNFHIVDEQLREIRDDLPSDYYRGLPKLAEGHLEGYPRVIGLAWAFVAHTDSRFDPDALNLFVRAYQRVEPLTIGELWAIAISLRIVLVENLRRTAVRIVRDGAAREEADNLADELLGIGKTSPQAAAAALRRVSSSALSAPARVRLFQRLRDQDPAVTPALGQLEKLLTEQKTTAEENVWIEHQRWAARNVTTRNVITSMRDLSSFDWASFVEGLSLVDEVLRSASSFGAMDFATRDRYRHAIEDLARSSEQTELDVARAVESMAETADIGLTERDGSPTPGDDGQRAASGTAHADGSVLAERVRDPGYYLISDGRAAFERSLHVRVPLAGRLRRAYVAAATPAYLGTLAVVTALALALPLLLSFNAGATGPGLILVALLALGPASDVAMALVNRAVTGIIGPRALPRLDLTDGVPSALRTLVAVPTLLTTVPMSRSRSSAWRSFTWPMPKATSGSHSLPTGWTPRPSTCPETKRCSRRRTPGSIVSTRAMEKRRGAVPASCSSIEAVAGTIRKAVGWDGNGNAASSTN